jgi:flagellar basal body-associated protein FliL
MGFESFNVNGIFIGIIVILFILLGLVLLYYWVFGSKKIKVTTETGESNTESIESEEKEEPVSTIETFDNVSIDEEN